MTPLVLLLALPILAANVRGPQRVSLGNLTLSGPAAQTATNITALRASPDLAGPAGDALAAEARALRALPGLPAGDEAVAQEVLRMDMLSGSQAVLVLGEAEARRVGNIRDEAERGLTASQRMLLDRFRREARSLIDAPAVDAAAAGAAELKTLPRMSAETKGGERAYQNLIAGATLMHERAVKNGPWLPAGELQPVTDAGGERYRRQKVDHPNELVGLAVYGLRRNERRTGYEIFGGVVKSVRYADREYWAAIQTPEGRLLSVAFDHTLRRLSVVPRPAAAAVIPPGHALSGFPLKSAAAPSQASYAALVRSGLAEYDRAIAAGRSRWTPAGSRGRATDAGGESFDVQNLKDPDALLGRVVVGLRRNAERTGYEIFGGFVEGQRSSGSFHQRQHFYKIRTPAGELVEVETTNHLRRLHYLSK